MTIDELRAASCAPLKGKEHAFDARQIAEWLPLLPGWKLAPDSSDLRKDFRFSDFATALGG